MIRNALIVNIKTNEIVNRIVHDDLETYKAPKGCKIIFEDDAKKSYDQDKEGNVIMKDIGDTI